MRVGILTLALASNYGAMMQAYALQEIIRQLGHDPEIIRLSMYRTCGAAFRHSMHMAIQSRHLLSCFRALVGYAAFRHRYYNGSPLCRGRDDLRDAAKHYDMVVVGSDQVWNTTWCATMWDGLPHFVDFAEGLPLRRISYAACVGDPNVTTASHIYAPPLLEKFEKLSVRNEYSKRVVQAWTGRTDIAVVADPTLLSDYAGIRHKLPAGVPPSYILAYTFGSKADAIGESALRKAQSNLNLPVVAVCATGFSPYEIRGADVYLRAATPAQWLSLFRSASYVVTNSFHGMLFSMKNQVNFNVYVDAGSAGSHRVVDAGARYKVAHRILSSKESVEGVSGCLDSGYSRETQDAIREHVNASLAFLKEALMV